jgi:hypothetical protein
VSGYGLDDRVIKVRSRQKRKDFSSRLCVQTGSGAHPASCTMGKGGPFSGAKERTGPNADHSPHLVPSLRMSRSYMSSPPKRLVACSGTALAYRQACRLAAQWPRGLRRRSADTCLLGSLVRIPLRAWLFVSCVYILCCPV